MSVLEAILASALFIVVATAIITLLLQSFGGNRLSNEQTIAKQYAAEGIEAARDIRNRSYAALVITPAIGAVVSNGVWALSGTSTVFDKYTRVLAISPVYRDADGNIISSGGTLDPNTKQVVSTVSWNTSLSRVNSVVLTEYIANWRTPIVSSGGMLAYGDGGTGTDAIGYRVFDGIGWGATSTVADVSPANTNRAARAVRIYSNPVTLEKVLLSRHYDGTTQYIYGQIYNATTTTWGNVQLLASWNGTTYLDVQNFDGTYLANGMFMAVYSDATRVPKSRTWNGATWSTQAALTSLGSASDIPNYVVVKARPGTNEAMAAFFTQGYSLITQYYGGTTWSGAKAHSANAPVNTKRFVDFAWSPNNSLTGMLVYVSGNTAKKLSVKVFVANGSGSGTWGTAVTTAAQPNIVGAVSLAALTGRNEFHACDKDAATVPTISCFAVTFTGNSATPITPANNVIATATDKGIQRSYHLGFASSGNFGMGVYSDNTAIPKLKRYNPALGAWDANATTIGTAAYGLGTVKSVRVIPSAQTDDMMVLIADANLDLYSVLWDGTTNAIATAPVGRAFLQQGVNGSASTDFWYDFTWDLP